MRAFRLSLDNALLFYGVCEELGAKTEAQRLFILDAFVQAGRVDQITDTPKTKDEYVKHLAKHFTVATLQTNGSISSSPIGNDQPKEGI